MKNLLVAILLTHTVCMGISQEAGQTTMRQSEVALGEPIEYGRLDYPKQALNNHVQGAVVLKLLVGKNGKVKGVSLVNGDPMLSDAASHAAKKWVYGPYLVNGKTEEVTTTVTINFRISKSGQPNVSVTFLAPKELPFSEVFKAGDGIPPPKLIFAPSPEYSREAIDAHYQGVCVISLIVGPDGLPYNVRVSRPLDFGLNEKAINCVKRWRFAPSTKDGKPVAVAVNVEVTFRLSR